MSHAMKIELNNITEVIEYAYMILCYCLMAYFLFRIVQQYFRKQRSDKEIAELKRLHDKKQFGMYINSTQKLCSVNDGYINLDISGFSSPEKEDKR